MQDSLFLTLGLLLVTGLLFGLISSRWGVPRIAAYALAGLIWSPDILGDLLSLETGNWSARFTELALAIMAYLIGGSVTVSQLSRLGKVIFFCTVGEVFGAALVVTAAVWLFWGANADAIPLAVVLGTLAVSTTPATTVAVIHQYRANGPLTTTLLGVVALDDAFGVILFSLVLVWLGDSSLTDALAGSGLKILGALFIGALMGWLLAFFGHRVKNRNFLLPMTLSALFLSQGLAESIHVSPLLTAMSMGFASRAAFKSGGERLFAPIEYLEELVFLIFFTLAGAHFDIDVFMDAAGLVVLYVFARVAGKMIGATVVARLSQAPAVVTNNIGLGVIPQAGIETGLALSLLYVAGFEETGLLVVNVVLAGTLFYEFLGPLTTRYALSRAGELKERHGDD